MNQIKRQWIVLTAIPEARSPAKSTEELHRILEELTGKKISKRTVERDLQALREDFDIRCRVDGKTNWWAWDDVPPMSLPGLTPEQALAFYMVEQNLKALLPEATLHSLSPFFRAAERKLDAMPASVRSWKKKFRLIDSAQMLKPASLSADVVRTVRRALLDDKALQITYLDRSGKRESGATIYPLALTQRGVGLYLIYSNLDEPASPPKFIGMQRLQKAGPSLKTPVEAVTFDLDAYLKDGHLGFGHTYSIPVGSTLDLVAVFSRKTAERLAETKLDEGQQLVPRDDGRTTLTAHVKFSGQFLWWLLSYGSSVEVLEPPELRELMAKTLKAAAAQYERNGSSTRRSTTGSA
jgi:predicted DNA-binding transcriptional regulator YafY